MGGRTRVVEIRRAGRGFAVDLDGRAWRVDARKSGPHTLSLIVDSLAEKGVVPPWSYDVVAVPGPTRGQLTVHVGSTPVPVTVNGHRQWGRAGDAGSDAAGPQRVTAPMPGKVVRLLVKPGDAVAARQGLVVVEAMKMENELRASRAGTVAEVHAREGLSVDAGALLVVIQ